MQGKFWKTKKNSYIETYCLYIDFETLITFYNVNKYLITGILCW